MRTKLKSARRSESNEEAVVDGNGNIYRYKAVQPQPLLRFLLSLSRRVVHQASSGILMEIDERGDAEGGEDSLSIPECASAGPLLWLISRTPSDHVHIYSIPIVLCLPISFSIYNIPFMSRVYIVLHT